MSGPPALHQLLLRWPHPLTHGGMVVKSLQPSLLPNAVREGAEVWAGVCCHTYLHLSFPVHLHVDQSLSCEATIELKKVKCKLPRGASHRRVAVHTCRSEDGDNAWNHVSCLFAEHESEPFTSLCFSSPSTITHNKDIVWWE